MILDHVKNTPRLDNRSDWDADIYSKYILSPRIEVENLTPWRRPLTEALSKENIGKDPQKLIEWIDNNITLEEGRNPQRLRMSPLSVFKLRRSDRLNRNVFFVAAARSLGMPARIDPVTSATQYLLPDGTWRNVEFKADAQETVGEQPKKATLALKFSPVGHIVDPKYYSQFSLSRITEGYTQQLAFDEGSALSELFAKPVELEPGQYVLTTGQRLANGGVLARSEIFTLKPGENATRELTIRHDDSELSVIGSLNAENIYHDIDLDTDKNLLSTTGRGYYVVGFISPNHEPSAHALNDISAIAGQMEATGRKVILLFDSKEAADRFKRETFSKLPSNVVFGIDNGGVSRKEVMESLHLDKAENPLFVVADTFNRVVWYSTGYTIGIGDQILSVLHRVL